MARTISASVGLNGVNRPDDVTTVQLLLNKVPTDQGGPAPPLVVDGICGPKTRAAIQKFQLHHFGWAGADGRVDPGQQTMAKLNQFDTSPVTPPVPVPPEPEPEGMDFVIVPAFQQDVFEPPITSRQFTYLILDVKNNRERVYQLQFGVGGPPAAGPFTGFFARFRPRHPTSVSGFEGIGVYMTSETINPGLHSGTSIRSSLSLFPPAGGSGTEIPMKTHLFRKSTNPDSGGMTTSVDGKFKLIR